MLLTTLQDDLKKAVLGKDAQKSLTLRSLLSAVNYAKIDLQREITDDDVISVLNKEVKKHRESIEMFKKGNRPDLWEKEEKELEILLSYLPKQMTKEEVRETVQNIIAGLNDVDRANFGKVMSSCMSQLKGRTDGALIAGMVKELISNEPYA